MKKAPPFFLLFFYIIFGVIISNNYLLAYAPIPTHANLTDVSVDFYNQNTEVNKLNSEEKSWVIQGSIDEDTPNRCLNHFYDPIFNKTWTFGGIEYLYPALTAKDWAQNPIVQALYDPLYTASLGPISKSPVFSSANFTWQKAIYSYIKGDKKSAYLALGHILHLIEDMTVPAHTREDSHPPIFDPDIYEDTPSKFSFSVYQSLLNSLKGQKPLIKSSLNEYFDDTANYSNNYFLSSDTIPPSKYKLPEIDFPDTPEIDVDGIIRYFLIGHDEKGNLFHLAKKQTSWRLQTGLNNYTLDDEVVLNDYWQRLSKKSVVNSAGVINLFFQEVTRAKQDPNFIKNNESNIFLASLSGINNFINNIFQKNNDYVLVDNSPTTNSNISFNSNTNNSQISPIILSPTTNNPKNTTTTLKSPTTTLKSTTTILKPTTTTTTKLKTTTTTTTIPKTTTTTTIKTNLCSFPTSQFPLRNKIIINEVAWMGTSNSSNDEWIELKNISSGIIDLSNWQLLDQGEQIKIVFPSTARLEAEQFLLLERSNDETVPNISADIIYAGSLANQNEGLRLFDNNCQLQDEVLAQPDWLTGDNSSKRTMERKNDLTWQTSLYEGGTPKAENSSGYITPFQGGGSNGGGSSSQTTTTTTTPPETTTTTTTTKPNYPKILITEIKVAGLSSDGKTNVYDEFIELYNSNNSEVDLTDWYLQKKTSQSNEFSSLVPSDLFEGKIINPSGYFLISHSSSTYQDIADILDSNYSVTDSNTIVLKNPNREIVDKVGFGETNDCEGNCATDPDTGKSIQRKYLDGNFLDSDNNLNDFEIQNCPSPKALSSNDNCFPEETTATTTTTTKPPITSTPAVPYITEFSWHPFDKDSSKIVIDFRTNSYPFIPASNNVYTAMAFYLHSDNDPASSTFGLPTDYLGGQDNWSLGSIPGLVVKYLNCGERIQDSSALIFTNSETGCYSWASGSRGLTYNWRQLPKDNHFLVEVSGTTKGQGLNFTPDQYVTICYYGYDSYSSNLKLVACDPTKFYFNSSNYYHPPTNVSDFEVRCDDDLCNNLIFSWAPASDEDLKDILKYDLHYVFAKQDDNLNNNDLTQSWDLFQSQNVLGEPIFNSETNRFSLEVPLNNLYYLKEKRLPGVPINVFFGIKAVDSEGLKSPLPKIVYLYIPPSIPQTTTTTTI